MTLLHYFFDLPSFYRLGQKFLQKFRWFLVNLRTPKNISKLTDLYYYHSAFNILSKFHQKVFSIHCVFFHFGKQLLLLKKKFLRKKIILNFYFHFPSKIERWNFYLEIIGVKQYSNTYYYYNNFKNAFMDALQSCLASIILSNRLSSVFRRIYMFKACKSKFFRCTIIACISSV